jgi:hypothetical protein
MEKFVKRIPAFAGMTLIFLLGCSAVRIPNYIKADHPYIRKISGDYDAILLAIKEVLSKEGWQIQEEVNPAEYERHEGGEDQGKDVLFFTEVKRYSKVAYSTYTHLNVFVHANADGAEVDVRYEALIPSVIKRSNLRNDKLAQRILDEIEQSVESK